MEARRMANFPDCAVCKKPFKWKGSDPYLLPCLHAICEICLTSTGTGSCLCSKCQRVHNLSTVTLQKDQVRTRLILHLTAKHRPAEILCTHEDDGNQAVCWCQECEEFLCEHCQNLHEEFKATRRHEVQGIIDIGSAKDTEESFCTVHRRYALELMDHDCGILICLKCKQEGHAEHRTEDVNTAIRSSVDELTGLIKAMDDVKIRIQDLLKQSCHHADELDKAASSERDKIKNTFAELKGLIDQREKEVMLSFDTHVEKANAAVSSQRLSLDQHLLICSDVLEYTQTALDHACRPNLPIIMNSMRNPLEECLQTELLEMDSERSSVTFQDENLRLAKTVVCNFSGVCYNGKRVDSSARDKPILSYEEIEKVFKAFTTFKTTSAADNTQTDNKCVPTYKFQKDREYQVRCDHFRFSTEKMNIDHVHLNDAGVLCNGEKDERFKVYNGTSSTEPLLQTDYVQYWETLAKIELDQMISFDELLLEIGVCWEEDRDKNNSIEGEPHSYCIYVSRCRDHRGICITVANGAGDQLCFMDTLQNKKGSSVTLHWGLLYDPFKKQIAFLDLKTYTTLEVMDNLDTSQPLWPMYGVCSARRGSVNVELIVGKDIDMSEDKRSAILHVL